MAPRMEPTANWPLTLHASMPSDKWDTAFYRVTNDEVECNLEGVLDSILNELGG
jgi:hypothetical protein